MEINKQTYQKNGYIKLPVKTGLNTYQITINYQPTFVKNGGGYSLIDGPLVYALKVDEEFIRINENLPLRELPHGDFEVHNKSKFNYALGDLKFQKQQHKFDEKLSPFVSGQYPVSYLLDCYEIKYRIVGNYVQLQKEIISPLEQKEFIPLGINKLHMGTLPLIKK